jgi:hypothetical protein
MKSIVKNVTWDIALQSHKCKRNVKHIIAKGDRRLKIKEGRSESHYCMQCAETILKSGLLKINGLRGTCKTPQTA